jgi:TPR repeat protein
MTAFAHSDNIPCLGDYWGALSLYEEAADLGVWAAQENAAYLIEKIGPAECAQMAEDLADNENQPFDLTIPGTGGDDGHASTGCATAAECCVRYLERRAAHRWAQLSSVGEPRAMRKMAGALQGFLSKPVSARTEPNVLNSELALGEAALPLQQQPAVLYALAGEQGDTESMLNLGWMLYYGSNGE